MGWKLRGTSRQASKCCQVRLWTSLHRLGTGRVRRCRLLLLVRVHKQPCCRGRSRRPWLRCRCSPPLPRPCTSWGKQLRLESSSARRGDRSAVVRTLPASLHASLAAPPTLRWNKDCPSSSPSTRSQPAGSEPTRQPLGRQSSSPVPPSWLPSPFRTCSPYRSSDRHHRHRTRRQQQRCQRSQCSTLHLAERCRQSWPVSSGPAKRWGTG